MSLLIDDPDSPFDPANWRSPLLAVGWLEHPHPFAQGEAPAGLLPRIRAVYAEFFEMFGQETGFLGLHVCSICDPHSRSYEPLPGSSGNLFVPGVAEIFVAPGRIDHHIEEHSYLPPSPFIDAIFACPSPRSLEYLEALRNANAGAPAALIGDAELNRRIDMRLKHHLTKEHS